MGRGRIDAPLIQRRATSRDGTSIAYYVIGDGPRLWLMPPAMGAPLVSMARVLERFAREYTIVTWDQRGFYASGAPADPSAMRIADHLEDMRAVIAAEELGRFVLGGWSMAVQLSLEYVHHHPDDVRALVLINGPYERALRGVAGSGLGESAALLALRAMIAGGRVLNALSPRLLGARGAYKVLHRAGVFAEDEELFEDILAEFCRVDWVRYFTMTRFLHEHSAADYLPKIRVPTLITGGTRDLLTPVHIAERMHRAIPGSELFVVPGATHYIVAEYPEILAARIAEFLKRTHVDDHLKAKVG